MNKEFQDRSFSNIFRSWIGMADCIIDEIYYKADLDNEDTVRFLVRKDVLPYFPSAFCRKDLYDGLEFLRFASSAPNEVNIERLFASNLVALRPPVDKGTFFAIVLDECSRAVRGGAVI